MSNLSVHGQDREAKPDQWSLSPMFHNAGQHSSIEKEKENQSMTSNITVKQSKVLKELTDK